MVKRKTIEGLESFSWEEAEGIVNGCFCIFVGVLLSCLALFLWSFSLRWTDAVAGAVLLVDLVVSWNGVSEMILHFGNRSERLSRERFKIVRDVMED